MGSGLDPARPHRGITQRACGVGYTTGGCNNVPIEDAITETIEYVVNGPIPVVFLWRWADEPNMPLRKVRKVAYKPE